MVCSQLKVKKHVVGGAILFIWIAAPAFEITMACLASDIVKGTCVPWGAYSSYAIERTVISLIIVVTFLLPMLLMVASYSRIVYVLRNKVTNIITVVGGTSSEVFLVLK